MSEPKRRKPGVTWSRGRRSRETVRSRCPRAVAQSKIRRRRTDGVVDLVPLREPIGFLRRARCPSRALPPEVLLAKSPELTLGGFDRFLGCSEILNGDWPVRDELAGEILLVVRYGGTQGRVCVA